MKPRIYSGLLVLIILSLPLVKCSKDEETLPAVITHVPAYIASTTATLGCTVVVYGESKITECGLYMGVTTKPESSGTKFQIARDTGIFLVHVTGLLPASQYFIRAYAVNSKGEAIGEEVNFTTPALVTDIENNQYETVKISSQTWMASNLRTTHFQNGDAIPTTTIPTANISSEVSPEYQWSYGGFDINTPTFGKLYTWYAITDPRKICPAGWHVPGDAEWTTLENTLGGYTVAGSRLKEDGNAFWASPYNMDATNESCFTGLPGGYRSDNGSFYLVNSNGYWWTSTESTESSSWARIMDAGNSLVSRTGVAKKYGASVRCIKD
jgi:uncharacterized protein (TIGR02145 family)